MMDERLTAEHMTILQAPFPVEEIEFLRGKAYVTEMAVTTRIEVVDPAWTFEVTQTYHRDNRAVAVGRLTILSATRGNIGMGEDAFPSKDSVQKGSDPNREVNDPEKSAATDCLKRCARLFGIGRYLLTLPKNVTDENSYRKWLTGQNGSKTKTKKVVANTAHSEYEVQSSSQQPVSTEPVEDMIISHVLKTAKSGKNYHSFKTASGRLASVWSRQLFIDAGWIDENDWQILDRLQDGLDIPVMLVPDGDYWKVVEVAACTFEDIPM